MDSISHNLRTVVLDPRGRVFKIMPGNEWTARMLADAMKAADKGGKRIGDGGQRIA